MTTKIFCEKQIMEESLLQGKFQIFPSGTCDCVVTLTRQNIMFKEETPQKFTSLLIQHVIGCKVFETKIPDDVSCVIQVTSLIKNKKGVRQKQMVSFRINESSDKQENLVIAEAWARTLSWLLHNPCISVDDLLEKDTFAPQKNYFVLINPKSGQGKSLQLFKNTVEPLLQAANIKYSTLVTEYSGHCQKMVQTFNFKEWDAVIICSGDGLAYEYFNGIMYRQDWKECLELPLGILPTGSGNALSSSILFAAKERMVLMNAIYVILKGVSHPMDMFSVQTHDKKYFGFLSLAWGLVSDVDIESEKYRVLGGLRFTIGALTRILRLRHYVGKLSYRLASQKKTCEVEIDQEEDKASVSRNKNYDGTLIDEEAVCAENDIGENMICTGGNLTMYGPSSTLVGLQEELPTDWTTVSDEFVTVSLVSMTHLAPDMYASPQSFLDDGMLNLQYIRKGINKKGLLNVFTRFENGTHIEIPELETVNITAFRLDPQPSETGNITVDGERIRYGRLQGEIHPSLANILMLPDRNG